MQIKQIHLDTVDSTMSYAKTHAATLAQNPLTCITAEEQTAGRGRYQRKWLSPKGVNLYVTFFFHLPKQTRQLNCLAHIGALSLSSVLLSEGLFPHIKWPNDILLGGKKIAGVLCELVSAQEIEVILGIGLNVNMSEELLGQIDQPATSLQVETGRSWDRQDLLLKLQTQFVRDLKTFKEKGFTPFHSVMNQLLANRGKLISVQENGKELRGICRGVTVEGKLELDV